MFPKPKRGLRAYWCPSCRRKHLRNSSIGHLHKVYIEIARAARHPESVKTREISKSVQKEA